MKKDPPRRRHRALTEEEISLWHHVARSVVPLPESSLPALLRKQEDPDEAEKPKPEPPAAPAPPKQETRRKPPLPAPASLDPKTRQKLSRGKLAPERSLDLHGLFQQQAFAALRRFLVTAQQDGVRLVLVVTGKGENKSENKGIDFDRETGVLRRSVPLWLSGPELRELVVGFEAAGRHHGGGGALYIRLRRLDRPVRPNRKDGPR